MQEIEERYEIVFLRDKDKLESIKALKTEEEYQYLLKNGKYHKRERQRVE